MRDVSKQKRVFGLHRTIVRELACPLSPCLRSKKKSSSNEAPGSAASIKRLDKYTVCPVWITKESASAVTCAQPTEATPEAKALEIRRTIGFHE